MRQHSQKKARVKCGDIEIIDNVQVRGNVILKHKNKHYDKKISEVIKKIDNVKHITECFQDKHGEKWNLIDSEAREGFAMSTVSKIKCAEGRNICDERMQVTDKSKTHACFPSYKSTAPREHVVLYEKIKNRRDAWINKICKKLNKTAKK